MSFGHARVGLGAILVAVMVAPAAAGPGLLSILSSKPPPEPAPPPGTLPPVVTCINALQAALDATCCANFSAFDFILSAQDPDGPTEQLTFCVVQVDGGPPPGGGCEEEVEFCEPGTYVLTIQVTDVSGQSSFCDSTLILTDTRPPAVVCTALPAPPPEPNGDRLLKFHVFAQDNCCIDPNQVNDSVTTFNAIVDPIRQYQGQFGNPADFVVTIRVLEVTGCPASVAYQYNTADCSGNTASCSSIQYLVDPQAARATTDQKGSVLIFPKVDVRWYPAGNLLQDTFIELSNDYPDDVHVTTYFVSEHCLREYADFDLTANQPKLIRLSTLVEGAEPRYPDPAGSGDWVVRGWYIMIATNLLREEIRWNHLTGLATLVHYGEGSAWEYKPWAFQTRCVEQGEQPIDCAGVLANGVCAVGASGNGGPGYRNDVLGGIAGRLDFDGFQYDLPPAELLMQFIASGATAFGYTHETDVALLPLNQDLRQGGLGPPVTKVLARVWNEDETSFAHERCIVCWDETLLSTWSWIFTHPFLQTDAGHAHLDGVASALCEDSTEHALLGVVSRLLTCVPQDERLRTGVSMTGIGREAATILFDPLDGPSPEK